MTGAHRFFLVGDVGATNARLAIAARTDGAIEWVHETRQADALLASFDAAIDALFAQSSVGRGALAAACFGIAGPIHRRRARFTNRDWVIDADALEAKLRVPVTLVNDLAAAAAGIDGLPRSDFEMLQNRSTTAGGVRLVIGAGTGLGVAYAVQCDSRYRVVASEGGHAGFAPQNERQRRLFDALAAGGERVDAEHVVSGAGLERIYGALRSEHPERETPALRAELDRAARAAAISRFALERADPLATEALDLFIDCYGSVAGDHALAVLPYGGVFVVGGIAAKILPRLTAGGFVRAFTAKGEFAALAKSFPIAVVTNERLGLVGATLLASEAFARRSR
jgi:glucokinase